MIQFSCPNCAAVYSVPDQKAGKTGTCPKCQTQFIVPDADPAPAPEPEGDVAIKPCPKCASKLVVAPGDLGKDVECPKCQTVYRAVRAGAGPSGPVVADVEEETPRRKRRFSDEDVEDDEDDDRPRKRSRRDDDEDDDDRPRKRRRRRSRNYEPHRGMMILIFGIIGFVCCGFFAFAAAIMGRNDLQKIDAGDMDPEGRGLTLAGMILGYVGSVLIVIAIVVNVALIFLNGPNAR